VGACPLIGESIGGIFAKDGSLAGCSGAPFGALFPRQGALAMGEQGQRVTIQVSMR